MADTAEQMIDMPTLCERLALRPAEVYREVKQGRLTGSSAPGKTVFTEEAVQAFLDQRDNAERDLTQEVDKWLESLAVAQPKAEPSPETVAAEGAPADQSGEGADEALDQKQVRLADTLLNHALSRGALDVYVDPVEGGCRILYRLAGAVHETGRLSAALGDALRRILKGRLGAIEPVSAPQSGAFAIDRKGTKTQVCGTVAPTLLGEHIHLALQDVLQPASLGEIGYTPDQVEALRQVLNGSPGAFLSSGPVDPFADRHRLGLAATLAAGDRLVVSLERRPHLKSETLVQLQIGASEQTDFGSMFDAALAMSPTVLFLDDIRTPEETRAVFEGVAAGMTVVVHVRAADNAEALLKLVEAGVSTNVLARDILGLSAQRVVRGVCRLCRTLRAVTSEEADLYSLPVAASIAVSNGCAECSDGFAGRRVFHDLWLRSPGFTALVRRMAAPNAALSAWGRASPQSLDQALRSAVVAGDVLLADVAPLLLVPEAPMPEELARTGGAVKQSSRSLV